MFLRKDNKKLALCKKILKNLKSFILKDPILFVAFLVALVSSFFVAPSLNYFGYIDYRVLCLLFSLMLVVAGLKYAGIFDFLIDHLLKIAKSTRSIAFLLVGVCFFSSMLITNDVSLITFVPLTIMLLTKTNKQKLLIPIIVLQTIAANLGSMFLPMGNPQNLYLFSLSNMTITEFLKVMFIPTAISFFLLFIIIFFIKSEAVSGETAVQKTTVKKKDSFIWGGLFLVCLLSVLRIIPYTITIIIVIITALIFCRTLFKNIDYGLLLTFIFLFIFIGNIKNIPSVSSIISSFVYGKELTTGILLSQVISNVPAAMLMSGFTSNYSQLLLGVNIGGLGTLIASMASVISYKLYIKTDGAKSGKYLLIFTLLNIVFLFILWGVTIFI